MSTLFFLISFLSNAFFVFLTLALIVQGALCLFGFKNYRVRSLFRLLPLSALLCMPLLHKLQIGQFLNPLSCGGWVQKLFGYLSPKVKEYLYLPKKVLGHYLSAESFTLMIEILVGIFVVATLLIFITKLLQMVWTAFQLKKLLRETKECSQLIQNPYLQRELKRYDIRVLSSGLIHIPMAIGSKTILISQKVIELLKPEEFESVIAHELAHLLSNDPWVRLFGQLLKAFFWWIPMKSWLKRVEEDQEIACDQMVSRYRLSQEDMASALFKMARFSHKEPEELVAAFCKLTSKSHFLLIRLGLILGRYRFHERWFSKGLMPFIAGPLIILSCTL